jgi:hypothetical protein
MINKENNNPMEKCSTIDLSKTAFLDLETRLRKAGFDIEFDTVRARLLSKEHLSADEFAERVIYVVLAGGFKQKNARKIYPKIMNILRLSSPDTKTNVLVSNLLKIFGHLNKTNAIAKIWQNRDKYCNGYYLLQSKPLRMKLEYLLALPHIGKITVNHLARNLGENVAKYDIWIQRLGVAFSGKSELVGKINNTNLQPEVKKACDEMFAYVNQETELPIGYIDLVLWRACEEHMFDKLGYVP